MLNPIGGPRTVASRTGGASRSTILPFGISTVRSFPDSKVLVKSPHLARIDPDVFAALPHSHPVLVPPARLAHIKRVNPVAVVVDDTPVDAVAHAAVQLDRGLVLHAHKQVDEPGVFAVADALEGGGQARRVAQAACGGRDGQAGDVGVIWEVVGVGLAVDGRGRVVGGLWGWVG